MKKIVSRVLFAVLGLAFVGCANYTLIRLKVDVASLVGTAALKTTLQFSVPKLVANETVPNTPEGQLINNFPKLEVLNSAELEIVAQTSANLTGNLSVYIAPSGETNIYQDAKYLVSQPPAAGTSSVQINFAIAPVGANPTPEQQRQADALKAIQTGKFRVGIKIQGNFDSAQQQLDIALTTFKINISGYPIKAVPAN
jgi:hypothetical protein